MTMPAELADERMELVDEDFRGSCRNALAIVWGVSRRRVPGLIIRGLRRALSRYAPLVIPATLHTACTLWQGRALISPCAMRSL